jgi:hypothetical protein
VRIGFNVGSATLRVRWGLLSITRALSVEGKAPQRASAEADCSRSKIGDNSVIAARSRASRSLAPALFEGALARGLLQIATRLGSVPHVPRGQFRMSLDIQGRRIGQLLMVG